MTLSTRGRICTIHPPQLARGGQVRSLTVRLRPTIVPQNNGTHMFSHYSCFSLLSLDYGVLLSTAEYLQSICRGAARIQNMSAQNQQACHICRAKKHHDKQPLSFCTKGINASRPDATSSTELQTCEYCSTGGAW